MSPQDGSIDRRSVLKNVGAVGAAAGVFGAASTSGTAASEGESTIRPLPVNRIDTAGLVAEVADELLAELAAAGTIESPSVSALPLAGDEQSAERADRAVSGLYIDDDLGERSLLTAEISTDDGTATVSVEPERDLAYAILEPDDGERMLFTAEHGTERLNDPESSPCPGCTCYYNYPCTGDGRNVEVCTVESNSGYPCVTIEGCC